MSRIVNWFRGRLRCFREIDELRTEIARLRTALDLSRQDNRRFSERIAAVRKALEER